MSSTPVVAIQGSSSGAPNRVLLRRLGLLTALLTAEWLPISAFISTGRGGQSLARLLAAFGFFFFTFGYRKGRSAILSMTGTIAETPISARFLAGHAGSMAVFLGLSLAPFGMNGSRLQTTLLVVIWLAAGFLGMVLAAFAFVPPRCWVAFCRATGHLWIFAALAAAASWRFVIPLWSVWGSTGWSPAIGLTFSLTKFLLGIFIRDPVADPATALLGTHRFSVTVGAACSGIEGAGLMLAFSTGWLWFFRRECRFPQALVLVPASVIVMWLLNSVRLVVLILIGDAGAPQIAMGGFHSQAGWVSFNLVACGVLWAAGQVPWWSRRPETPVPHAVPGNPTAKYLVPFIAILAAGMVATAVSAGFEWLYPLRLFAAAAALWIFRLQYRGLDWRCSWFAPLLGAIAFLVWMGFDMLHGPQPAGSLAGDLASLSPLSRSSWILCRTVAAVVTVPIAEELAFRAFLIRRLIAADFEKLGPRSFTWLAVLISSVIFGLLHGGRCVEGTIVGMLYAVALLRRGRIGDAVAAHATTNALIAAMVLVKGDWYLW